MAFLVLLPGFLAVASRGWATSIEEEAALGRRFEWETRARLPRIPDPDVQLHVESLGQRLVNALGSQPFLYRFTILRDARMNAFAVPGGAIYVNGGLLLRAANDDEVAAVLAHEVAHVHARHLARQQEDGRLLSYASVAGLLLSAIQPAAGAGLVAAASSSRLRYRRELEREADILGVDFLRLAGIDPIGLLRFFDRVAREQQDRQAAAVPYLQSHPLGEDRVAQLEGILKVPDWRGRPPAPSSLALERARVLVRLRLQPVAEVVGELQRRLEDHPAEGRAHYLLGLARLESGSADLALSPLAEARRLGVVEAAREQGRAELALGQFEAAAATLAAFVADRPDPVALGELGRAEEARGRVEAAIERYREAVVLAPFWEPVQRSLGRLLGRTGREGEGFDHLAEAALARGDLRQALEWFEQAESRLPSDAARGEERRQRIAELRPLVGAKR